MAVYTPVARAELEAFLAAYDLGPLIDHAGVEQGVENTNYILTTARGRFVLTLFEKRAAAADLPFFAAAMAHVAARGIPAPWPVADNSGRVFSALNARPAAIFTFLDGRQRMAPSVADCGAVGAATALLHLAGAGFEQMRPNALSLGGWRTLAEAAAPRAEEAAPNLAALIADELAFLEANWPEGLPEGLIHADLFPDNVFFDGGEVSGVIDFYFACTDFFIYDLALALNAWAAASKIWNAEAARGFIKAYEGVRPLSPTERAALPVCLRGASLRILLTRLYDWLHRAPGAIVKVKDPLEYRDLLLFHRAHGPAALTG